MNDNLDLPGEYEDYRENILSDFANKLKDDPKTILFDEDEWIEIADYALDVDDRFLFVEAVIWGLSAYPGSKGLRDREAILLSEFVDNPVSAFTTLAARPKASKITMMLKFEATRDDLIPPSFYKSFKKTVIDDTPLADHETIELVRILSDAGCLDMLIDELPFWEKHVQYTQTLWYEIAACAYDNQEYALGLEVIDKLLAEHPYNPDYWLIKSKLVVGFIAEDHLWNSEQLEELKENGAEAVENVLAIRPDDLEAKRLRLFFGVGSDSNENTSVKFDENTVSLFRQAIEAENHEGISRFCKIIPQSWFNKHMDLMIYLSLSEINDSLSNKILKSWIQCSLSDIYDTRDVDNQLPGGLSVLQSLGETFYLYNDHEAIVELYDRIESVRKTSKYPNPLEYEYAISCLTRENMKEFNKSYNRLIKDGDIDTNGIDFKLLTFFKDTKSGKKDMCVDAASSITTLYDRELSANILTHGLIKMPSIRPSALNYMIKKLYFYNFKPTN